MTELIIDSFAGGGGASLGIAWATGRCPDIAINHDPHALAMHAENHPSTLHVLEDVWRANLAELVKGRPVGLLWASPDCRHFSRAKGGKPVSKQVRSLAWIVCKWAAEIKPRVIILENVREFETWGPLVPLLQCRACEWRGTEGQASLARTRHRCPRCNSLRLAETTDHVPCPKRRGLTFRRWAGRLRNLGYTVRWHTLDAADYGAPTHRRRLFLVARRDGEPIVWPEPTHVSPAKLDAMPLFDRPEPWRTAAECIDWALPCPSIFDRKRPLAEATQRRIALGIKRYVLDSANPFLVPLTHHGADRVRAIDRPLPTITTANRGELALVSPLIAALAHGSKGTFGDSRSSPIARLLGTIHAGGGNHALVAAFVAKHFGGMVGVEVDTPLPTTTTKGTQNQIVATTLIHMNHGEKQWSAATEPMRTLTTGRHAALVYCFLVKYFGTAIGQSIAEPLHTVTSKGRFGLVTVAIDGQPYAIVDIGMRMLQPRELARCQGFPDTYVLTGTKTQQIARIGNSVCPQVAAAMVRANYVPTPTAHAAMV